MLLNMLNDLAEATKASDGKKSQSLRTSITQLTLCQVTTSEIDAATKLLDKACQKLQVFFSSSVADVALKARSLHESKQEIQIARTKGPWSRQIDWINKNKNHNQTKNDDPQIPQPDLRFASGNSEANSETPKTHQKTGPEPKQNTHKIDLPGDAVACPLHLSQKRAMN